MSNLACVKQLGTVLGHFLWTVFPYVDALKSHNDFESYFSHSLIWISTEWVISKKYWLIHYSKFHSSQLTELTGAN